MSIAIYQKLLSNPLQNEEVGILRVFPHNIPKNIQYPQAYKFFTVLQKIGNDAFLHGGKELNINVHDMSAMRLAAGQLECDTLIWTHNGKTHNVPTIKPFPITKQHVYKNYEKLSYYLRFKYRELIRMTHSA
jgi:hypothetical protein